MTKADAMFRRKGVEGSCQNAASFCPFSTLISLPGQKFQLSHPKALEGGAQARSAISGRHRLESHRNELEI